MLQNSAECSTRQRGLLHFESASSAAQRLPPELFIPKLTTFNFFENSLSHLQLRRALLLGKGRKIFG